MAISLRLAGRRTKPRTGVLYQAEPLPDLQLQRRIFQTISLAFGDRDRPDGMWLAIKSGWMNHPWVTAVEVFVGLLMALEVFFFAHVVLARIWGAVTRNPYAMIDVRFILMTGHDAAFGGTAVALLALLPSGLLLSLVSGGAWWKAPAAALPDAQLMYGTYGGLAAMGFAVVVLLLNAGFLGGGLLPR